MVWVLRFIPRAGTKYSVAVFGMFDGGQSMPLAGEEKTTLSDAPEPPSVRPSGIKSALNDDTFMFFCGFIRVTCEGNKRTMPT